MSSKNSSTRWRSRVLRDLDLKGSSVSCLNTSFCASTPLFGWIRSVYCFRNAQTHFSKEQGKQQSTITGSRSCSSPLIDTSYTEIEQLGFNWLSQCSLAMYKFPLFLYFFTDAKSDCPTVRIFPGFRVFSFVCSVLWNSHFTEVFSSLVSIWFHYQLVIPTFQSDCLRQAISQFQQTDWLPWVSCTIRTWFEHYREWRGNGENGNTTVTALKSAVTV